MPELDLASVRLHYQISGAPQGEALVLMNSLGSSLRMWDKLLPRLEAQRRVIRCDTRGHGNSSAPPGPYSVARLGEDLLTLLDRLAVDRADFCGVSLGGLNAMWIGIHAPRRVRRLILANTAARVGSAEQWEQRMAAVRASGMAALADASLDRWFTATYRHRHPDEIQFIREMIAATPPEGYIGCCAALRDADLRPQMGSIQAPCLVIAATHDAATPPAEGQALCAAIRNSTYVELNAAHISPWEAHEEFGRAALEFLSCGQ